MLRNQTKRTIACFLAALMMIMCVPNSVNANQLLLDSEVNAATEEAVINEAMADAALVAVDDEIALSDSEDIVDDILTADDSIIEEADEDIVLADDVIKADDVITDSNNTDADLNEGTVIRLDNEKSAQYVNLEFLAGVENNVIVSNNVAFKVTSKRDTMYLMHTVNIYDNYSAPHVIASGTISDNALYVSLNKEQINTICYYMDVASIYVDVTGVNAETKISDDSSAIPERGTSIDVDYDKEYDVKLYYVDRESAEGGFDNKYATISDSSISVSDKVSYNKISDDTLRVKFDAAAGTRQVVKMRPTKVNDQDVTTDTSIRFNVSRKITKAYFATGGAINVTPGTDNKYYVTYYGENDDPNADYDSKNFAFNTLSIGVSGNAALLSEENVKFDDTYGYIIISANPVAADADPAYVTIYRKDRLDTQRQPICAVKVNPTDAVSKFVPVLNSKSIKYKTDSYVALDLVTKNKGELKGIKGLKYQVTVTNQDSSPTPESNMITSVVAEADVDPDTGLIKAGDYGSKAKVKDGLLYVTLVNDATKDGTPAKFKYSVKLVQKNSSNTVVASTPEPVAYEDAKATPRAVYSTSIGLGNKKSKGYTKQKDFEAAKVKLDSATTYKSFSAVLYKSDGSAVSTNITCIADSGRVIIEKLPERAGVYTLEVTYSPREDGAASNIIPLKASMPITVVSSITKIELSCPDKVYKAAKKSASVSPVATLTAAKNADGTEGKLASKKLEYSILSAPGNTNQYVTINKNSGKVSIKANCPTGVTIKIQATAKDNPNPDSAVTSRTYSFRIVNQPETIATFAVVNASSKVLEVKNGKCSATSTELSKLRVVATKTSVEAGSTVLSDNHIDNVEYKSSNSKVLTVDSNTGELTANKLGKAKITARTTDGGKKTASISFEVVAYDGKLQLKLDNTDQTKSGNNYSEAANYSGPVSGYFTAVICGENANELKDYCKYSLTIKGGKRISVTSNGESFNVQPTAATTEITIKYGNKQTAKYTVTNKQFSSVSPVKISKQNDVFVAGRVKSAEVKYSIKDELSGEYYLNLTRDEAAYAKLKGKKKDAFDEVYKVVTKVNSSAAFNGYIKSSGNELKITVKNLKNVPAGTYSFKLQFAKDAAGTEPIAKPTNLKLVVSKAAKVSFSSAISATMKKAESQQNNTIDISSIVSVKNAEVKTVELVNARTKTGVNTFIDKYEITDSTKIASIRPKEGTDLTKVAANDCVGYLKITYTKEDTGESVATPVYVKVTVKLK